MKRMPFIKRPTEHYDEHITQIDEHICELIKQRKEISNNNPGYPPFQYIANWAEKYDLYENQLKSVFLSLWNEDIYKPVIEPVGFIKNLQVLKSVEKDKRLFSVIFIRQYSNSSLVNFNIDWNEPDDLINQNISHSRFELFIEEKYCCRMSSGSGSEGHFCYNFVVTPSLPDNLSGINLIFKEYTLPYKENQTGNEIVINL